MQTTTTRRASLFRTSAVAIVMVTAGLLVGAVSGNPSSGSQATDPQVTAAGRGPVVKVESVVYRGSPMSLEQLVAYSTLILVGRPVGNTGMRTEGGRSISTVFDFQVESTVLARDDVPAFQVAIAMPGGRVGLPDGSWAQVNVSGFRRMEEGKRYLVFIRPAVKDLVDATHSGTDRRGQVFEPAFGVLGVYDVTDDGTPPVPAGGYDLAFARELRQTGMSGRQFIERVAAVAAELKGGGA